MSISRKHLAAILMSFTLLASVAVAAIAQDEGPNSPDGILLAQAQSLFGTLPDKMPGSEQDTPQKIALGEALYFETAISVNGTQSCNSCHPVDNNGAGADNRSTGLGALGKTGDRNDPPTFNAGFQIAQFWDGRAPTLKEQAKGPVLNPIEMGMPDEQAVLDVLAKTGDYARRFETVYGKGGLTYDNFADAVAAFERTLISTARFDDYLAGDVKALTELERRGLKAFIDENCVQCHTGDTIGGKMYQKMGVYHPFANTKDIGREKVTENPNDKFVFKVPMLRNVTLTGPYFHDGAVFSLAEAIDQMAFLQLDKKLDNQTIQDMMRFMVALADDEITQQNPVNPASAQNKWVPPTAAEIEALTGEAKYGHELVTQSNIHPDLAEYVGNELTCVSCHQNDGTKQFSLPWIGVSQAYPQYRGRENREVTLEERINGCFERSMNGTAMPVDSKQMKAIVAYMDWLSKDALKDQPGLGTPEYTPPNRKADLERGEAVYQRYCMACHGEDGMGYVPMSAEGDAAGLAAVPALWGDGSYNNGAGTARLLTAAAFIKHSMPLGISWTQPTLNDEDVYDVAGYVNSMERPQMAGLEKDYPDLTKKPADCPYPPYLDEFPQEQHQFGPFQPIMDALNKLKK